jgi:hypothetical protein
LATVIRYIYLYSPVTEGQRLIQIQPLEGWHLIFYFGNFISDTGIALFAIRASYTDIKLDRLSKRYNALRLLAIKSTEVTDDMVETLHGINTETGDPQVVSAQRNVNMEEALKRVFDDGFINFLLESVYLEDIEWIIYSGVTGAASPETIKPYDLRWKIYHKKNELGAIASKALEDLREHRERPFNKYALDYRFILSLFLVGILVQGISLIASIFRI